MHSLGQSLSETFVSVEGEQVALITFKTLMEQKIEGKWGKNNKKIEDRRGNWRVVIQGNPTL